MFRLTPTLLTYPRIQIDIKRFNERIDELKDFFKEHSFEDISHEGNDGKVNLDFTEGFEYEINSICDLVKWTSDEDRLDIDNGVELIDSLLAALEKIDFEDLEAVKDFIYDCLTESLTDEEINSLNVDETLSKIEDRKKQYIIENKVDKNIYEDFKKW